jgi:hypothetical protein
MENSFIDGSFEAIVPGNGREYWSFTQSLERVKGIEPSYAAWEAAVLPLNYTRLVMLILCVESEVCLAAYLAGRISP